MTTKTTAARKQRKPKAAKKTARKPAAEKTPKPTRRKAEPKAPRVTKQACVGAARFARKIMNLRACDRVRACVRPLMHGSSSAAGRYGDARIGSKSKVRA
jgi:hypothetical protein